MSSNPELREDHTRHSRCHLFAAESDVVPALEAKRRDDPVRAVGGGGKQGAQLRRPLRDTVHLRKPDPFGCVHRQRVARNRQGRHVVVGQRLTGLLDDLGETLLLLRLDIRGRPGENMHEPLERLFVNAEGLQSGTGSFRVSSRGEAERANRPGSGRGRRATYASHTAERISDVVRVILLEHVRAHFVLVRLDVGDTRAGEQDPNVRQAAIGGPPRVLTWRRRAGRQSRARHELEGRVLTADLHEQLGPLLVPGLLVWVRERVSEAVLDLLGREEVALTGKNASLSTQSQFLGWIARL